MFLSDAIFSTFNATCPYLFNIYMSVFIFQIASLVECPLLLSVGILWKLGRKKGKVQTRIKLSEWLEAAKMSKQFEQ